MLGVSTSLLIHHREATWSCWSYLKGKDQLSALFPNPDNHHPWVVREFSSRIHLCGQVIHRDNNKTQGAYT